MTWRMPAESEPHERTWMAFPTEGYSLGDTAEEHHEARATWAAVAHAVAEFEPVTVVADPGQVDAARRYLSRDVELVEAPLNDAWMRDIGPTFVLDDDGRCGGVDWVFNGWGAQDWARWDHDARIASFVLERAGVERVASTLVNEGGGMQVDGLGTVLLTETVQLDPGRNPHLDKAAVEAELRRTIGATCAIWLPRGLTRDQERYGTRGHVDIVAAIASPGVVLVHDQRNRDHPDFDVTALIVERLQHTADVRGEPWRIVRVPAPATVRDDEGWVDYSYINHYVVNGGVIACRFGDPADDEAAEILAAAYPGRRVVGVDARPLFRRGGGIHCITQHQPR
ncbi:agmatine deiminase family protein [Rhodococcus aetherivorans]|uniref:agmatine deiminase family protein n=2 Tax=Nocardiaceae TaxID=85025 RepID=UPI0002D21EE1|nr:MULTISPECIES: agmatine deiminase family protein [Rhodococcus]NCL77635.1 Agmatine deiminase [Rhodococcus sp. YH1]AKE91450.1 agmatine deiminase [Rhodococcus aetherivorans]QIX52034.1 agmatine deiminase family protein [Rhodococcus sp. DMU1]USC14520.1 agmatine deiminase family protein [Rhodococcus sp. 11-3]WKW97861.1 agmatine deiminase family protein [Rhodococcus aetherivorans]